MRSYRLASLEQINYREFTKIWNRCWQGYYYNMYLQPTHMKAWLDLNNVSLNSSTGILSGNQVVGFALLSIDNSEGWIAGACIDPDYRGQGLFEGLMRVQLERASQLNLKRVYLEVLQQNHALKVYQTVGFAPVRELFFYRSEGKADYLNSARSLFPMKSIPVSYYFEKRCQAQVNPAWQRRERYLRRHANHFAVINLSGTAGALFAGENSDFLIDVWSSSAAGAEEVISALLRPANNSLLLINQPKDWIYAFLNSQEVYPSAAQYEMCIQLA